MNLSKLSELISTPLEKIGEVLLEHLPRISGAFVLLLAGWIIARLLRTLVYKVGTYAYSYLSGRSVIGKHLAQNSSMQVAPLVVSRFVFWFVFIFFISAAIETLGLVTVSTVIGKITTYLPNVLAATAVVFIGILLGDIAREGTVRTGERAGIAFPELFGRGVQFTILGLAVMIAVDQLGIASTILLTALIILVGTTFGAGALAFSLGAVPTVRNILAMHYIRPALSIGALIRVGEWEGRVAELSQTSVILDTDSGRVQVPGSRFNEQDWLLLNQEG